VRTSTTRYGVALLAIIAPVLLIACGTGAQQPAAQQAPAASTAAQVDGRHNDTDVMFLQMMLAHHDQGLQMVRLAEDRAAGDKVRTLAAAVDATQSDEMTLMKSWLSTWSKPATVDHAPSAHSDHGGLPATGPNEIKALRTSTGTEFEKAFLNLFVAHQHNAVEMAKLEDSKGINADTKAFAERIRQSRTDQIQQMLRMLNS
jgi:uncharacterized protein (DUF305 family)